MIGWMTRNRKALLLAAGLTLAGAQPGAVALAGQAEMPVAEASSHKVAARSASAASSATVTAASYTDIEAILRQEAAWLAGLQFESGAIPTYAAPLSNYADKYKVVPYFTHLGLLGLLEKPEYAEIVRSYADWYFSRLNRQASPNVPAGSVFDYFVETDRRSEKPTNDFDSTDSYASTFLNLLRKYAETTGDTAYLQAHRSDIELIAGAMLSTKQADGLTWAKPGYRVKYLMDNAEVYKGLHDMEWISSAVFGDEPSAAIYRKHKEDVRGGIEKELWSDAKQAYAYAKMEDGSLLYPDWSSFYADATAQLFPIWTGVIPHDGERALALYNKFNAHHPGWPQLNKADAFPWALLGYTAAIMGDRTRTEAFLQSVRAAYIDRGHPWPWYVMESGVTMLAAARLNKLPTEPRSWTVDTPQSAW